MAVDLPEVHARSLDTTRVFVAGVGDDQWSDRVGLRRLDRARAREPHRDRQLVGRRARRGQDDRRGRRRARRRRARRRSRRRVRRVGGRSRPPRSGRRARWTRRARCRTGRCRARSTAVTGSSTCWSTAGTSRRSTGQDTTLPADLVDACWEVLEPQVEMLAASGVFGDGRRRWPTTPTPRPRLLAVLGRRRAESP